MKFSTAYTVTLFDACYSDDDGLHPRRVLTAISATPMTISEHEIKDMGDEGSLERQMLCGVGMRTAFSITAQSGSVHIVSPDGRGSSYDKLTVLTRHKQHLREQHHVPEDLARQIFKDAGELSFVEIDPSEAVASYVASMEKSAQLASSLSPELAKLASNASTMTKGYAALIDEISSANPNFDAIKDSLDKLVAAASNADVIVCGGKDGDRYAKVFFTKFPGKAITVAHIEPPTWDASRRGWLFRSCALIGKANGSVKFDVKKDLCVEVDNAGAISMEGEFAVPVEVYTHLAGTEPTDTMTREEAITFTRDRGLMTA